MTSYNLFEHKCSHLSILGTLFFFCFVLSHNKTAPNHFYNRGVPNHFHIKFLICSWTLTKYATANSRANQMFVMVGAEINSCVLLTLKHFPVMTLASKTQQVFSWGVWDNAVSSPSGAIDFRVFSLFESVANARCKIVKPVTTLSLNQTHFVFRA